MIGRVPLPSHETKVSPLDPHVYIEKSIRLW